MPGIWSRSFKRMAESQQLNYTNMNAIIQNDLYIDGRINVFSNVSGDQIGYITKDLRATPIGAGISGVFKTIEAGVKYILAITEPKETKKEIKNTNQQSLF